MNNDHKSTCWLTPSDGCSHGMPSSPDDCTGHRTACSCLAYSTRRSGIKSPDTPACSTARKTAPSTDATDTSPPAKSCQEVLLPPWNRQRPGPAYNSLFYSFDKCSQHSAACLLLSCTVPFFLPPVLSDSDRVIPTDTEKGAHLILSVSKRPPVFGNIRKHTIL